MAWYSKRLQQIVLFYFCVHPERTKAGHGKTEDLHVNAKVVKHVNVQLLYMYGTFKYRICCIVHLNFEWGTPKTRNRSQFFDDPFAKHLRMGSSTRFRC